MTENIQNFLKSHAEKIKCIEPRPIVTRWLQSPPMVQSLNIIDKYVGYLLDRGATEKINQWFLAGDENFNAITAERYILAYLSQRNENLVDNLKAKGIDGFLEDRLGRIGIEITTLNGFIGEWIFVERLTEFLDEKNYLANNNGLEISYSHARIQLAVQGKMIYDFIKKTGDAILSNDTQSLSEMKISIRHHNRGPYISFDIDDTDSFPWFKYITQDLQSKLQEKSKVQQLAQQTRNIIFVGLNHLSPSNWAFPRIFQDLANGEIRYHSEIQEVRDFWASSMSSLTNVIGICYFFYSLDSEVPFYPLKFFWRSEEDKIAINL